MSSYLGQHAELYDLFYADKPYAQEAKFIYDCLLQYTSSVKHIMELACGTGNHAFELEKYGLDILATDYSDDMLSQAHKKAAVRDSKVVFKNQNMTEIIWQGRSFDAVICLFDSIGYVLTNENLQKTFHGVREQLKEGGIFIFEFWHAAAMLKFYDPLRKKEFIKNGAKIVRISETVLDIPAQLAKVIYKIFESDRGDMTTPVIVETQINRFFLLQEMKHWIVSTGFSPVRFFSNYHWDEPITDQSWHIIAVARKI